VQRKEKTIIPTSISMSFDNKKHSKNCNMLATRRLALLKTIASTI